MSADWDRIVLQLTVVAAFAAAAHFWLRALGF
jgi:hypothetical protein